MSRSSSPDRGRKKREWDCSWRDDPAWSVVDRAEAALGEPLAHLITDAPAEVLARTRNAQLAVLLTSLVAWEAMQPLAEAPVAFAGHSLGQVTALIAAGSLPFDAGVRFAARRAELTQAAADAHPGRMAALLGATLEQAEGACAAAPDACWVANDNAPGQVVIAGTAEGLEAASARAKELGVKRVTPLNVGGAFHTPLMHDASVGLTAELATVTFAAPSAPVVSNDDASPTPTVTVGASGSPNTSRCRCGGAPRWTPSSAAGAGTFLEVGHGSMLAALAKRGAPDVVVQNISSPEDIPTKLEVG